MQHVINQYISLNKFCKDCCESFWVDEIQYKNQII